MANISYPTVPDDAIIDIQVSGLFYRQTMNALLAISESRPKEELKIALESMKENRASNNYFEATVRTLTALIFEIENKAKAQNKLKTVTIDEATGKPVTPSES